VRRLVVTCLVSLVALTGCSSTVGPADPQTDGLAPPTGVASSPAASSPVAPVPLAPPVRGVCRRMTYDQAVAPINDAEAVACSSTHTAQTYNVGQLRTMRRGHLLAVDSPAVQRQVSVACPRRLATFLGGSADDLRLSMVRAIWFTPSLAESDAGANWFRCDAVVIARADTLAPLNGRLRGALSTPQGRERFAMCGTDDPGAAGFERTVCRAEHTWRAFSTVDLANGRTASYPGVGVVREAGQELCDDRARADAPDALDYRWGYEWPTAQQWNAGQTYGRCWAPDPA